MVLEAEFDWLTPRDEFDPHLIGFVLRGGDIFPVYDAKAVISTLIDMGMDKQEAMTFFRNNAEDDSSRNPGFLVEPELVGEAR